MDPDDDDEAIDVNQEIFSKFMTALEIFPYSMQDDISIQHFFNNFPLDEMETETSNADQIVPVIPDVLLDMMLLMKIWASSLSHIVKLVSYSKQPLMYQQLRNVDPKIKAILKINADLQLPTPLVQRRKLIFYRIIKQIQANKWVMFDISTDYFLHSSDRSVEQNLWRRRSGVIVTLSNHCSKVHWIENVQAPRRNLQAPALNLEDNMYSGLINSKIGFSAQRWLLTLIWWFHRRQSMIIFDTTSMDARYLLLMLTGRMKMLFLDIVCANPDDRNWVTSSKDDVRFMSETDTVNIPGMNPYIAVTTFKLEASPYEACMYLMRHLLHIQWRMPGKSFRPRKLDRRIACESGSNKIALFKVIKENESSDDLREYLLREVSDDGVCNFVVGTTISSRDFEVCHFYGIKNDEILRPIGFAILPDGLYSQSSLVTIAMRPPVNFPDNKEDMVYGIKSMIELIQNGMSLRLPHG